MDETQGTEDEEIFIHTGIVSSLTFQLGGQQVYLLHKAGCTEYVELRRICIPTFRISRLSAICCDLFECEMIGSDGSIIRFDLTDEDIAANMRLAEEFAEILQAPDLPC